MRSGDAILLSGAGAVLFMLSYWSVAALLWLLG